MLKTACKNEPQSDFSAIDHIILAKSLQIQKNIVSLQTDSNHAIMEVAINSQLYKQASTYAKQQGLSLTTVIENFLVRYIGHSKEVEEQAAPDVVLSLLGAGEPVSDDDLNAREAYNQYLEEKYK